MRCHNQELDAYNNEVYLLKNKCNDESSRSRVSLRIIFRGMTRNHTTAPYFSHKNIESPMYRSRCEVEPPIQTNAGDFIHNLPSNILQHYRLCVLHH